MTEQLREQVHLAGGLLNQGDMARAWGLSRPRITELVKDPTFPEPITTIGGKRVWANVEVQAWRRQRLEVRR